MQCVILAAGRGVRMRELTDSSPKPMLEVHGKPILAYKIESLPDEVDEVILVVGYMGDKIREYFGSEYAGKKIHYVDQEVLNGTGGAVHCAKDLIKGDFLVMMGDDLYMKEDIKRLVSYDVALLGMEVDDPKRFGIILFDEKDNAKEIVEKPDIPGPALANIALYKLTKDFFEYPLVPIGKGEYGLPQTIMQMKDKHEIVAQKAGDWFPIGSPEDLKAAEEVIDRFS